MKKLIPLMTFAIIILFGCAKEEMATAALSTADQQVEETGSVWVLNYDSGSPAWELAALDELPSSSTTSATNRSNSAHAHGDYTGFGGLVTIEFSGTENNGGTHGSAEIRKVSGPFELHVVLETTSVVVDGNEAIYGGVITEVIVNTFPPPPPPPGCPGAPYCPPCSPDSVGFHYYFKVFDNGQGNNAPADQYQGLFGTCNAFPDGAASFPWFIFGPPSDVENEGDKIKVN